MSFDWQETTEFTMGNRKLNEKVPVLSVSLNMKFHL